MKTIRLLITKSIKTLNQIKGKIISNIEISRYLSNHQVIKLHIGCDWNIMDGWLNVDKNVAKGAVYLDIRHHSPIPNSKVDYIFCEHLVEHLTYSEFQSMLRESYRVMKNGAMIRIATPDMKFLINIFNNPNNPTNRKYIKYSTDTYIPDIKIYDCTYVINNFFYNWGHKFIHTEKTLVILLKEAGFIQIVKKNIGQSNDKNLSNLERHGKIISEQFNSMETQIYEATKP